MSHFYVAVIAPRDEPVAKERGRNKFPVQDTSPKRQRVRFRWTDTGRALAGASGLYREVIAPPFLNEVLVSDRLVTRSDDGYVFAALPRYGLLHHPFGDRHEGVFQRFGLAVEFDDWELLSDHPFEQSVLGFSVALKFKREF